MAHVLLAFIVERRKMNSPDWFKSLDASTISNSCTVSELEPNGEYEFRVRAKNIAGVGEPSAPSAIVKVC